jgi:hypothetical protein
LRRARHQRISLERIVEFLEEAAGRPLPLSLRQGLERAYRDGGRVRMERGWVLRVKDPDLLDYPAVHDLIQERVGPRVALVREGDREQLLARLVQEGVLAEVEEVGG